MITQFKIYINGGSHITNLDFCCFLHNVTVLWFLFFYLIHYAFWSDDKYKNLYCVKYIYYKFCKIKSWKLKKLWKWVGCKLDFHSGNNCNYLNCQFFLQFILANRGVKLLKGPTYWLLYWISLIMSSKWEQ